jgi:hypothetical protein
MVIQMARVHILGNSNAYGFGLKDQSWPSLIKADVNRRRFNGDQPRITTTHLASPGNLLHHIIDSGLLEASVGCNRRGNQVGIFCVGACEASILRSQGHTDPRRSKSDFKRDFEQLAIIATKLNIDHSSSSDLRMIILGTTPMDKLKSIRSDEGDDFNFERIQEYDELVRDSAEKFGFKHVELQNDFKVESMLARDGIHLNEAGEEFTYNRTMPAILEILGLVDNQPT